MKKTVRALGIMNGTSLDGVDYSLISVDQDLRAIKFLKHWQKPLPRILRKRLLQAARDESSTYEVSQLHYDLGRLYGLQVKSLMVQDKFDLIGLHGQTIHHEGRRATLQIGHPGFLSQVTGQPVYHDFRAADVLVGGEGAPFAPFFQKILIRNLKLQRCAFHNLGGISNLTTFHASQLVAFDTGPANILMDAWIQNQKSKAYDKDGKLASRGLPDPKVVIQILKHPYFKKKAPKSTGREDFNLKMINQWGGAAFKKLSFNDQLATLVEVTAQSIADSYLSLKHQPKEIFFYGGGVRNPYLLERIRLHLPDMKISLTDDLGWPSQAFESSLFAFLGAARHFNKTVHLPKITGAKKATPLGSLC